MLIMPWNVNFSKKAAKQHEKMPRAIQAAVALLMTEMRSLGPVRGNWSNYGKLTGGRHPCHLKKGNPTYVAVWETSSKGSIKLIEVTYVGTHEKAPY